LVNESHNTFRTFQIVLPDPHNVPAQRTKSA
jgi:hypothetical protein